MKRTLVSSLAYALAFGLSLSVARVAADPDPYPDPATVYIKDIVYNGSGCPPDSVEVYFAYDGQAFEVIYRGLVAEIGPGVPLSQSRKNCQLTLTLHAPSGFTYGILGVDYRGYANLAEGAKGRQKATYYFQG